MSDSPSDRPRSVHVEAYGCQMNVLDGELVLASLCRRGYERAESPEQADLLVFHTCSVRAHAEDRVLSRIGQLRRRKARDPGLRIAVMGCMAQRLAGDLLRQAPHVDVVCGTDRIGALPELLERVETTGRPVVAVETDGDRVPARDVGVRPDPFRAYVSVMRGCRHRCSYCIVPRVRGGTERSRPEAEIVAEVRELAADGVREVTLLGQNINTYGRVAGGRSGLPALLRAVHEVEEIRRIRFLTSNPMDIEEELLEAMAELPKVMEYLHFPAQSGSDSVLRRMARGYTAERYRDVAHRARRIVPGIELASDFIVGFPGETDADFRATVDLMEDVRFQQSFVFKYSPRPGTRAAELPDDVPDEVKRERNRVLLEVQQRHSLAINQARIGRALEVLVTGPSPRRPDRLSGRTRANQIAVFPGEPGLAGSFRSVEIRRVSPLTLIGEVVP